MAVGLHLLVDSLLKLLLKLAACLQGLLYVHLSVVTLSTAVGAPCERLTSGVVARRASRDVEGASLRVGDAVVVEGSIVRVEVRKRWRLPGHCLV